MRVRASIVALVVVQPWASAFSQEGESEIPSAVEAVRAEERLNVVKLMAQAAALPALKGENPFILRESFWSGQIDPGKAKLIQVQLFRRNDYQFWFAVPNEAARLNLNLYDSDGQLMSSQTIEGTPNNVASAVVTPETTGVYYVRISVQTSVDDSQDWAVIYAYR